MVSRMSRSSSTKRTHSFGTDAEVMRLRLSVRGTSLRIRLDGGDGQLDRKGGTGPHLARDANGASVGLDDLSRDVQPEPEAAVRPRGNGAFEAIEDSPKLVRFDSDSVVLHLEDGELAQALDPELDGATGSVLGSVAQQAGDDLFDAKLVPAAEHRPIGRQLQPARCRE